MSLRTPHGNGVRIRELRRQLGMRQADVPGISQGTFTMIEQGYVPSAAAQKKIAKAFGVPIKFLWPPEAD